MEIGIDFDGTVVTHNYPQVGVDMTRKEADRLKLFIKTHGGAEVNSHFWVINQLGQYIGTPHDSGHVYAKQALSQFSFLNVPFNKIKKLNLWISTKEGVYYF